MAGLSFWESNGKLIYENPRFMKFVAKLEGTSYTGSSQVPLPVGNNLTAVCFATANKTISGVTQQIKGSVGGFGQMHSFSGTTFSWNIPTNTRIGGWLPPFTDLKFHFYILAR